MIQNNSLKRYDISCNVKSLFTASFLENSAISCRSVVPTNLHWGRGDYSCLSFWFIFPILLSIESFASESYNVLSQRSPKLSVFLSRIIHSTFPLIKGNKSFYYNTGLRLSDISEYIAFAIDELEDKDSVHFKSGVFAGSNGVHYKNRLISRLHTYKDLADNGSVYLFINSVVNDMVELDGFMEFQKLNWEVYSPYFHTGDTSTVSLGLRSYYMFGDSMVCSFGSEYINYGFYSMCKLLQQTTVVKCAGFTSQVSGIPHGDGGLLLGSEDERTLLTSLVNCAKLQEPPFNTTVPQKPKPVPQGGFLNKPKVRVGAPKPFEMQKREYHAVPQPQGGLTLYTMKDGRAEEYATLRLLS